MNWKTPKGHKSVPRRLSMIVAYDSLYWERFNLQYSVMDYAELFTNANCCPAVANGRKSVLRSEQGQTTQTGEEHKKSLPSRPKTRRVSQLILIRVYWMAPSMVVV